MEKRQRGKGRILLGFLGTALSVALLTGFLVHVCNYLSVDDTKSYTRLTMHEMYEAESMDTVFLGSSHCFRAYDPELFTELTGKTSFNLGSSSQYFDTSYYLLREAAKYHDIQTVYLDIHYKFLFTDPAIRDQVQVNIISDYMRPSLNKLMFLTQVSGPEHYTNHMFPFRREWKNLGDFSYLRETWRKKQEESYKNYEPVIQEQEYYAGKGFVYSTQEMTEEEIAQWEQAGPVTEDLSRGEPYMLSYVEKIVDFCKEEGIRIIFVAAPSNRRYLEAAGTYGEAYAYVERLADSLGVPYMDFNLAKEEYLNLGEDSFQDVDHLNGKGAQAVTELLAELDSGQMDVDEYFRPWYGK